jgi:hypothetical protein
MLQIIDNMEKQNKNIEKHLDNLAKEPENMEWGPLRLVISCSICDAMYELNPDTIALHMAMQASLWDYIKSIQLGECENCKSIAQNQDENI